MNWHVSIITPPAIEPVTLEQALEHCHANAGVEDDWFDRAIGTARREAEIFQRRAFITQTVRLSFDTWPTMPILLPRAPISEVTSFKIYDVENAETDVPISNFYIDYSTSPARLTTVYGYTLPSISLRDLSSIQIQYTAGYGATRDTVPKEVAQAILIYVGYLYGNRQGEVETVPAEFYDLLAPQRMYL